MRPIRPKMDFGPGEVQARAMSGGESSRTPLQSDVSSDTVVQVAPGNHPGQARGSAREQEQGDF